MEQEEKADVWIGNYLVGRDIEIFYKYGVPDSLKLAGKFLTIHRRGKWATEVDELGAIVRGYQNRIDEIGRLKVSGDLVLDG